MINDNEKLTFLKSVELFANVPPYELEKLAAQFESHYLQSGEVLIKQGDKGDSLYLVISGRLRATRLDGENEITLGEMGKGELIGELALLTGEPRAATVSAIRDSALLKLSQHAFEIFISDYPISIMPIVRATIRRMLKPKKAFVNTVSTIAIVPAANNKLFSEFAQLIAGEFAKVYPTLYLNRKMINDFLTKNNISVNEDDGTVNPTLINWLNQQENEYRYIIYEADPTYSAWTRRSLRQADHILLVGESDGDRHLNEIEKEIFKNKQLQKVVDLIIVHPKSTLYPSNTHEWLENRVVNHIHHIKYKSLADLERLIRIITGKSISLVLNGGGARGLAHVGVYKALIELKIPIDNLAGVSFGALTGCAIAKGLSLDEIISNIEKLLINNKRLFYYTIPLLSITAGHSLTDGLKAGLGENTYIEDLWRNFFCIASNLSRGDIEIISSGLAWRAIRASVSLPAIFPPITNERNELLIDGGIMNNFPVDIIRHHTNGGVVIGARVSTVHIARADIPEGVLSGWRLLFQNVLNRSAPKYPNIADIIIKTIGLSSLAHENKMMMDADCAIDIKAKEYSLFDFKKMNELIEIGYRATMEKADALEKLI